MEAPSLSTSSSPTTTTTKHKHKHKHKHARLELFSAQLICAEPCEWNTFYSGILLLRSCNHYYRLFESTLLEPPLIAIPEMGTQAHVPLTTPEHSIPVQDEILICPWFFDSWSRHMSDEEQTLWRAGSDTVDAYISKRFNLSYDDTDFEMHFAVYNDAVEAYLDVFLEDGQRGDAVHPILIHGTVRCSNSFVSDSGASIILFEKGPADEVHLNPSSWSLPLSRRMVVVPRGSVLNVDVRLTICSKPEDASTAEGTGTVVFNGSSDHEEDSIPISNCGKVCVKVAWRECKDHV